MKLALVKGNEDKKSFRIFEALGAEIEKVQDLEKTDKTIQKLIRNEYTTIIITNEIAGFSEDIIKKYRKIPDIKIIITPPR